MSGPDATVTGFDAWAPTYEHSALQPTLYIPAQQRALQLAQRLMPRPLRVLDVGCGTGRLLRQARQQHPSAMLVGVDVAWGWWPQPPRRPRRDWRSATSAPPRSGCHLPVGRSTWWLRPCRCATGPMSQPGPPRSTGCWPGAECSSWRTCSLPSGAGACPPRCRGVGVMATAAPPAELTALLAAHRLVVRCDRMPWFRLPDVQVIAAQKPLPPDRAPPRQKP